LLLGAASALAFASTLATSACDSSLCETAVNALCHRANECAGEGADHTVFVTGTLDDPASGYTVTDYGTFASCQHQVGASCEGADDSAFDACEEASFEAACGEVPTAKGARLPDACSGVVTLPPPPA
jgi:hypothetical protein